MIQVEVWLELAGIWEAICLVRGPMVVGLDRTWGCMISTATESRRYLAVHPEKNVFTVIDIGYEGLVVNGQWVTPGYGRSIRLFDEIEFSGRRVRLGWIDPEELARRSSEPTWPPAPARVAAPKRPRAKRKAPEPTDAPPPAKKRKRAPAKKKTKKPTDPS